MFNKKLSVISYLLLVIFIIAAFFRLYNITQIPPGLYPDEAMNGNNALEAIATDPPTGGWKIFYPENNGREGLFINIQALSLLIFGNQPWALRLVSAIFGILTVLGLYFLALALFKDKKIALLSAFLLAVSFWHINFSRIGFRAIMAPFFLTWAVYFLIKSFEHWGVKKAIVGGIFFGLGFYSYIAYRATPLLILIIFIYWYLKYRDLRKEITKKFIVFTLTSIIVFAPLGYYFLTHPQDFFGRTAQISVFSSPTPIKTLALNVAKTAGMFNFTGDLNWRHNYAGTQELFWPVGIMFLTGLILGIYNLFRKSTFIWDRFAYLTIFLWLAIAALPVVVSGEGIPHALRSILMIPPIFMLAGFGGILIYEKLKKIFPNKFFLFAIRYSLFAFIIISAYQTYFIKWANNQNTKDAFDETSVLTGRELNSLPKELPKYVVVPRNGVDVRGISMPSQTIMFITDTFTPEKQKEKNIFYVSPDQINQIPSAAYVVKLK
ncbi:glycosyltransferase family 39 protein [Candidatus Wolfebacteria bacterium]|nr:glycosyltransferase family 39 protein [Candidatus Wolfebacteria bacterium]